jgi:hypothetical protein
MKQVKEKTHQHPGRRNLLFFLFLLSIYKIPFEISDLMLSDWVSFLAYLNLFGIKGFVVVVYIQFPQSDGKTGPVKSVLVF